MIVERRRGALSGKLVLRATLAWALICALLVVTHWTNIAARRFPDPDDVLRLLQVRDLMAGQGWFDLTQYRLDAANGGVAMHWSRLVDIPLLLVIGALTPLIGTAPAEMTALIAVPLFTLWCAVLLAARLAWRLFDLEAATLTALAMALSSPLLFQLSPLRIDHHGWQVVCALAAANALSSRDIARGGAVLGLALAFWLAISIEGLPMTIAFCGVAALRWLREPRDRMLLVRGLQVLAFASLALFAATRGLADLAPHCDTLSPPFLAVLCWSALGVTLLGARVLPFSWVIGGFVLTGAGALGIALIGAPQCLAGGFAATDPLVREVWLSRVPEGMPIWRQDIATVLTTLVLPLFGLIAAVSLMARSSDWLRKFWLDYALLLLAAIAVTLLVSRAGAVAAALASVPLGWQIKKWLATVRGPALLPSRALAALAMLVAFVPTLPLAIANAVPRGQEAAPDMPEVTRASGCDVRSAVPVLASLEKGEIAAPLDIGPALLLGTPHSVIASGHHRGSAGIRFVIELFGAEPDQARAMLATRGTSYLALCPALMEARIHAVRTPDGLADRILREDVPGWLEPVDTGDSGLQLWRIRRAENPSQRR